jgi:hypothetical protein
MSKAPEAHITSASSPLAASATWMLKMLLARIFFTMRRTVAESSTMITRVGRLMR